MVIRRITSNDAENFIKLVQQVEEEYNKAGKGQLFQ